jgi:ferredoxin
MKQGVFAAGDATNEHRSVVESIAGGRWTASQVDMYLGGDGDISETFAPVESVKALVPPREIKGGLPPPIPEEQIKLADGTTVRSEQTLDAKEALKDAKRCLKCDLTYELRDYELNTATCIFCGRCIETCPWNAIEAGSGYAAAAQENKEREEVIEISNLGYNRAVTILVISVAVMIMVLVISQLLS